MEEYLAMHWRDETHVLAQCVVALILGGALGWEREAAGKWAGFRTHMFVCLSSMLYVRLGQLLIADSAAHVAPVAIRADPVHIIAAIATGVSFLGAGTIFRDPERDTARGLTTAASLLATASIGVSIAIDRYLIAIGVTLLSLLVLHTLRKFEPVAKIPERR
jgi:putative Mg2+ transporter-C (MgtC) family protein